MTHEQLEYNLPPLYPSEKLQQILDVLVVTGMLNIIDENAEEQDKDQQNKASAGNKNETKTTSESKSNEECKAVDAKKHVADSYKATVTKPTEKAENDVSKNEVEVKETLPKDSTAKIAQDQNTKESNPTNVPIPEPSTSTSISTSKPLQTVSSSTVALKERNEMPKKPPRYVFLDGKTRSPGDSMFLPKLLPALESTRLEIMESQARINMLREFLKEEPRNMDDFMQSYPHPIKVFGDKKNAQNNADEKGGNKKKKSAREVLLSILDQYPSILEDQVYATALKNFNC